MSYHSWFEAHALKHASIVKKLTSRGIDDAAIIEYFDFNNMVKEEPDFCPLYAENKKCHELDELNCYLCACPNFRFSDSGLSHQNHLTQFSLCSVDSKDGKQSQYGNAIHQDCSQCSVPHHKAYITKHFNRNWKYIMKTCENK